MMRAFALLAAWVVCACPLARAQDAPPGAEPPPPNPGYTLRVFANLLQTATLILNADSANIPGITPDRISISLDGGPRFHPTLVRQEGNDPMELAVLLDVSSREHPLVDAIGAALPSLADTLLTPRDHVAIYVLDCKLLGTMNDIAPSHEAIARAVTDLENNPSLRDARGHHCDGTLRLWDHLATIADRLGKAPGRRVLLIASQGLDNGSYLTPERLALFLGQRGVSVFSMLDSGLPVTSFTERGLLFASNGRPTLSGLAYITASNGGLLYTVAPRQANATLERILHLLRTRYIVEFPAPDRTEGSFHSLDLRVAKATTVLPAGVGWTQLDPVAKDDPTTIQGAASPAVMGNKRPADPR